MLKSIFSRIKPPSGFDMEVFRKDHYQCTHCSALIMEGACLKPYLIHADMPKDDVNSYVSLCDKCQGGNNEY